MVPLPKIIWLEARAAARPARVPEPTEAMDDDAQVASYVKAYEWGGPTSALQLHHLRELSRLIRPGDVVLDLACGPGPLLLELAPLFRDTTFIGADLSTPMLNYLQGEARSRGLGNVSVLHEDIRTLPSLAAGSVDLLISTSALHHLRDDAGLQAVFQRANTLLKPSGGFYMFDFGLLKSAQARQIFVAEVAKSAPPLTAQDYAHSLDAAFPLDLVLGLARQELCRPFTFATSALMDFFYFLQTPTRTTCAANAGAYMDRIWRDLTPAMKMEHLTIRWFRRTTAVR